MSESIPYVVLFFVVIAIILLLALFARVKWIGRPNGPQKNAVRRKTEAKPQGLLVSCPLCNSKLLPGEDIVSRVYRPMKVGDQRCTIHGCPHCYPAPEPGVKRTCPVCHKTVPVDQTHYLVARLFTYANGKRHVVVTGCTECCRHAPR
ncbi:MAG: hypothetical protein J1D88_09180 [Treponema sp.]|nr:hypothetical protein [Treponema sp.]